MLREQFEGLRCSRLKALESLIGGNDLAHPDIDGLQVVGREHPTSREFEVVIEAVLDRRPDGMGGARPQVQHGLGQHMGC